MKQFVQVGSTSKRMVIFVQNATSTVGAGLTGLTHASSGLEWWWYSETSGTDTQVTLAGQTLGTWTSGGFVQVDATNLPGFYELGIPNVLLTGTTPTWVTMQLAGAVSMVPVNIEIELTGFNPANGTFTSTVVGTVTATVPTLSTNVNVVQWLGTAVTSNAGVPLVDINSITGTVTATVVGGTIDTVNNPVSISTGQLTVKRNTLLDGFTFPMYDATTGNPATGLSVSCSRTIDGSSISGSTNSPAEVGNGIYKINLSAADLDGGVITLLFTASSASTTIITLITQS
jgi:hypothetical protein